MARKIKGEDGRVYVEKKRGGCLKWLGIGVILIFVLAYFGSQTDTETTQNTSQVAVSTENVSVESVEEVVDNTPQEYKNALKKGQSYADTMHMSKQGVYDQLTSEYGEGFPAEAAQYAIDNINVDWKENALKKATSYYEDMAMSKDGVYDQLVSEYGEQFTAEEAQYAVDNLN